MIRGSIFFLIELGKKHHKWSFVKEKLANTVKKCQIVCFTDCQRSQNKRLQKRECPELLLMQSRRLVALYTDRQYRQKKHCPHNTYIYIKNQCVSPYMIKDSLSGDQSTSVRSHTQPSAQLQKSCCTKVNLCFKGVLQAVWFLFSPYSLRIRGLSN